jgi:hypothetical protein
MVKPISNFPVRGVPGGWRDEWSAPDDAAIVQAQFATWAASNAAKAARTSDIAPPSPPTGQPRGERAATARHILVGVSQPTDDPSQYRAFALWARFDAAASGWMAQFDEQNHNDQIDDSEPTEDALAAPPVFATAAACLGAAVARLIEQVDRDAADAASSR